MQSKTCLFFLLFGLASQKHIFQLPASQRLRRLGRRLRLLNVGGLAAAAVTLPLALLLNQFTFPFRHNCSFLLPLKTRGLTLWARHCDTMRHCLLAKFPIRTLVEKFGSLACLIVSPCRISVVKATTQLVVIQYLPRLGSCCVRSRIKPLPSSFWVKTLCGSG